MQSPKLASDMTILIENGSAPGGALSGCSLGRSPARALKAAASRKKRHSERGVHGVHLGEIFGEILGLKVYVRVVRRRHASLMIFTGIYHIVYARGMVRNPPCVINDFHGYVPYRAHPGTRACAAGGA